MNAMLRAFEHVAWSIAVLCLAWVGFTLIEQAHYTSAARALATSARATAAMTRLTPALFGQPETGTRLPAPEVRRDRRELSDEAVMPAPEPASLIGELEVPQLHIATAVLQGDSAAALRRGAGHLPATALPWQPGNTVLAGHRDTVFRRLGELQRGDRLRVTTAHGVFDYRVTRTLRVSPRDVSVLDPDAAALTLITCYPFTWLGSAPERWIVQAERARVHGDDSTVPER